MTRRPLALGARAALVAGLALTTTATTVPAAQASHPFHPAKQTSISLRVYTEKVRPIDTAGGVRVGGDGFGSAVAPVPGHKNQVYGLTDPQASTGETITDLAGRVLPTRGAATTPKALVALEDGTFWVSGEYRPFITHVNRKGRAISRLSPYDGTVPRELALRTPNRGMEGLPITPDGRTLVGIIQSALTQADAGKPKSVAVTRIVTVNLRTHRTHAYAYVLDDPKSKGTR